MEKHLFLGDEAIAQAAIDAGMSGVYAYPGTPSTEITEYIQNSATAKQLGIHSNATRIGVFDDDTSRFAESLDALPSGIGIGVVVIRQFFATMLRVVGDSARRWRAVAVESRLLQRVFAVAQSFGTIKRQLQMAWEDRRRWCGFGRFGFGVSIQAGQPVGDGRIVTRRVREGFFGQSETGA